MGHCKDCKWWDVEKESDYYEIKEQQANGKGLCLKAIEAWSYNAHESLMVTVDGSQYMALLFTKPEFGCVLFEEKE